MNPYHFNNPHVRAIAFIAAEALNDMADMLSARLAQCEANIAELETKGGRHAIATPDTPNPIGLVSLNAAPAHPTFMMRLEKLRQIPLAKVPLQDVDASADHYSHGLSGRLGNG